MVSEKYLSQGLSVPTDKPEIALVVKTKNRGGRLEPFFNAMRRIENACPWELLIVDGSTDDTGQLLKEFAESFAGQITVITELRPGGGLASNRGWQATTASIIAFTDDDCYPEPYYLKNIKAVFEDGDLGFCCGRTLLYDPTDAPITINESTTEQFYRPGDFVDPTRIQGCNLVFRRETLLDIGGYDDQLGVGMKFGSEDLDVVTRALASGWKGKYDPRLLIYHHHRRKPGTDVKSLIKRYDADAAAFFTKCILFMPQRWQCLRYWLKRVRHQPLVSSIRQLKSAFRFFVHICMHPKRSKH